jgi:hypothetical protein
MSAEPDPLTRFIEGAVRTAPPGPWREWLRRMLADGERAEGPKKKRPPGEVDRGAGE